MLYLCEPCATYSAERNSPRPYFPDCDCFHCSCELCGDMKDGCNMDHQPDQPNKLKTLTEVLRCSREASCRELLKDKMPEYSPQTKEKENQGDTKVQMYRYVHAWKSKLEREFEAVRVSQCYCIDCLLLCDTACPDPTVTPEGVLPDLDSSMITRCVQQESSYEVSMSELQLALLSLQDKCKQEDCMIAAMTKELKPRFDDKDVIVDFDKKEVCDSLLRPICDPNNQLPDDEPPASSKPIFLKISSVCSKKDVSCQCSTTQCKPSAEKLLESDKNKEIPGESAKNESKPDDLKCTHPNYPDFPCYSKSQPEESKSPEGPIATEENKSFSIEQDEFPENILNKSLEKENELAAKLTQTVKENITPLQILEDMQETLGESALSYSTVKKWSAEFKLGRSSIKDETRPGHPKTVATSELVENVEEIIVSDRHLKLSRLHTLQR
ncbi:hypothetical protein ILUMI_14867 [Ignelater luminosus]|uniref:Uncharacterized protein n=1 Tax=Ignelater luminosus TaxID=2038154 RepID=A0A8K0CTF1_IGNLU|nr:hypothetical protein ILUMI_14867 [Ignelater luminosus]